MAKLKDTTITGGLEVSGEVTIPSPFASNNPATKKYVDDIIFNLPTTLTISPSNFESQTAKTFLASPNDEDGVPTFREIIAEDIPVLNQNTTGTASNITGTVAIGHGGTGQTTKANAFNALSPLSASGDIIYGATGGAGTRLAKGAEGTILKIVSGLPAWGADLNTTYSFEAGDAQGQFKVTPLDGSATNINIKNLLTTSSPTFSSLTLGSGSPTWTIDDTTENVLTFKDGLNTRLEIKAGGLYVNGSSTALGSGTVTSVTATGAIASTGGTTPQISVASDYTIPTTIEKGKYDTAYSHTSLTNNPHSVTATQVGLGTTSSPTFAGLSVGSGSPTWTIDDTTANVLTFKYDSDKRLEIKSDGLYVNGSSTALGSGTIPEASLVDASIPVVGIVQTLIKNINGKPLTNYTDVSHMDEAYPYTLITYQSTNAITEAQAKTYMKSILGVTWLPQYDYDWPKNIYIIDGSGILWKPQWTNILGTYELRIYYITKITTDLTLSSALTDYVLTSTKVNGHELSSDVTVTASDVDLGNVTNESKTTMFTNPTFTGTTNIGSGSNTWTITDATVDVDELKFINGGTIILPKNTDTVNPKTIAFTDSVPNVGSLNTNNDSNLNVPTTAESFTANINLHKISKTGTYSDLLNKPTIPATNIIPAITATNKVLVSTTTSGTAKWSDWSSAGFLKTNASGDISIDENTYLTSDSGLDASKLSGTISSAVLGNSTHYIGTTAVTLNRASATLALTGVTNTNWDSAYTATNSATSANTTSTIVKRGTSGEFSAGAISGTAFNVGTGSPTWTIDDAVANVLTFKDGVNTRLEIKAGGLYVNGSTTALGSGTVTSVTGTGAIASTGGTTPQISIATGYTVPTTTEKENYDSAYTHSTTTTGSVHGSTTVGGNLLRLTNVVTSDKFLRINFSDNSVSALDAATFRTAIGATASNHNHDTIYAPLTHNHTIGYYSTASVLDLNTTLGTGQFSWGNSSTNTPVAGSYGQGINIVSAGTAHNNSSNWITQLAFSTANNTAYFRGKTNSGSWGSWHTLYHTGNKPTATDVGLGNVTNESKATMFTSPTFTGTVSGVTASMVGLGNVTNESKTMMFTNPVFTGTATTIGSGSPTWTIDDTTSNTLNFKLGGVSKFTIGTSSSGTSGDFNANNIEGNSLHSITTITAEGSIESDGDISAPQGNITGSLLTGGLAYSTTAPTANNTSGLKIYVGSTDPATKYAGWLYIIT